MILVDTSVWVDYFNGLINRETDSLDQILGARLVVLGDLILTEVLQGFRSNIEFQRAHALFAKFPLVELGGYKNCFKAASNYRLLRSKGITVRKTIDMIIGTACIEQKLQLLHRDHDFDALENHLGLMVIS